LLVYQDLAYKYIFLPANKPTIKRATRRDAAARLRFRKKG